MSMREEIAVWTNLTEPRVRVSVGRACRATLPLATAGAALSSSDLTLTSQASLPLSYRRPHFRPQPPVSATSRVILPDPLELPQPRSEDPVPYPRELCQVHELLKI